MKLMYCEDCGDFISPLRRDLVPRWCTCTRHAVWWRDGTRGLISVHDVECTVPKIATDANPTLMFESPRRPRAWLFGVTNALISCGDDEPDYAAIAAAHPDTYLFKTRSTCIVRFRPGRSSDSRWERRTPAP